MNEWQYISTRPCRRHLCKREHSHDSTRRMEPGTKDYKRSHCCFFPDRVPGIAPRRKSKTFSISGIVGLLTHTSLFPRATRSSESRECTTEQQEQSPCSLIDSTEQRATSVGNGVLQHRAFRICIRLEVFTISSVDQKLRFPTQPGDCCQSSVHQDRSFLVSSSR